MNFNLPYLLQNGMKILNIVNKTLPLVKEFNPALNFITKKIKNINTNNVSQISNNIKKIVPPPKQNNQLPANNTLTFFK